MRKHLPQIFFVAIFLFLPQVICGQAAQTENQTTANEDYQLNISESRVTENDYTRSTQVKISPANNQAKVSVGVGAAVHGEKISITLRGVTGNVRFRASLEDLIRRIENLKPSRTSPAP